ncbi:MAG: FAD-dependent oxidoreductase [Cyanobacteria bacterium SID2]|nr:FAD-dependent oxidoreductase [Cyanobacteria bacterium SID2]MBP0005558.1 FAD-dependent oxidoreductase [Cyanobacteria bacterium SBC]
MKMPKVLVIGGGMGGVEAAIELQNRLKGKAQVDLISNRDFLYLYPASIWLTVGHRTVEDLSLPIPQLSEIHGFNFLHEEIQEVNTAQQKVITDRGERDYDYLIVALGGSKLKPKGIEHTRTVCRSPQDGIDIQETFLKLVEQRHGTIACGFSGNPLDATAVRGGPMFEVTFNFDTYLRQKGLRDRFDLLFFTPSPKPGKRLGEKGLAQLAKLFQERNIKTFTGRKIKQFKSSSIIFEDDDEIQADLIVFTPGMTGNPVLKNSDLPLTEAGFVPVSDTAQVQGLDNCYAIGDSSFFNGPAWRARQGHLAELMARTAAENIALQIAGQFPRASFAEDMHILCVMDLGDEAVFVYRDEEKAMAPQGAWARWAKLAWEKYYKLNKHKKVPRLM